MLEFMYDSRIMIFKYTILNLKLNLLLIKQFERKNLISFPILHTISFL